jgi:hypothetical protein
VARNLSRIIEATSKEALAEVVVCNGSEWEISTPAGIRKPDVFVIPSELARAAIIDESPKVIPGCEVLLAVEVISRPWSALSVPRHFAPVLAPGVARNFQAIENIGLRRKLRDRARQIVSQNPELARELMIGRPDLPRTYDDGGLIDANYAPVEVLVRHS